MRPIFLFVVKDALKLSSNFEARFKNKNLDSYEYCRFNALIYNTNAKYTVNSDLKKSEPTQILCIVIHYNWFVQRYSISSSKYIP